MTTWRKVLAWETTPEEDAEVPEHFTPVDPIDLRIYRMPEGRERDKAILDRITELSRADSTTLHDFTAPFTEEGYGNVYFQARSMEEAKLVLRYHDWSDSETVDFGNFELTGPPEPR